VRKAKILSLLFVRCSVCFGTTHAEPDVVPLRRKLKSFEAATNVSLA